MLALRRAALHRLRRAARRPPLRRRPRHRRPAPPVTRASRSWSSATTRAATRRRRSTATSATRGPRAIARRIRLMRMAEKFQPADRRLRRHAGRVSRRRIGGARRGRGDRRSTCARCRCSKVPVVVVITGEGGSGGALGIAIGDRILMQEYAIYSVIPPEGCAAILWRDPAKKVEAADRAEADRARSARRAASSTRSSASRSAAPTRATTKPRRCSTARCAPRWNPRARPTSKRASPAATTSSATWAAWAQILRTKRVRDVADSSYVSPQRRHDEEIQRGYSPDKPLDAVE